MAHRRFRVATQGVAAHDKVATRHCECCVRNARVRDDDSSKGRPHTSYLPMRHSSAVRLRRRPQSLIYACTMGALTAVVLACDHNASTVRVDQCTSRDDVLLLPITTLSTTTKDDRSTRALRLHPPSFVSCIRHAALCPVCPIA